MSTLCKVDKEKKVHTGGSSIFHSNFSGRSYHWFNKIVLILYRYQKGNGPLIPRWEQGEGWGRFIDYRNIERWVTAQPPSQGRWMTHHSTVRSMEPYHARASLWLRDLTSRILYVLTLRLQLFKATCVSLYLWWLMRLSASHMICQKAHVAKAHIKWVSWYSRLWYALECKVRVQSMLTIWELLISKCSPVEYTSTQSCVALHRATGAFTAASTIWAGSNSSMSALDNWTK